MGGPRSIQQCLPARWAAARLLAGLAGLAALAPATPTFASPLLELIGDLGGPGGLSARHGGAGPGSTYFNPALLPRAEPQLRLRVLLLHDRIDIDVAARPDDSSLIAEGAAGAFRDDGDFTPVFPSPLPTTWLEEGCQGDCEDAVIADPARARPHQGRDSSDEVRGYLGLGLVQPLIDRWLVLGMSVLVPTARFVGASAFYNDEREQYFSNSLHPELYSDRLAPLSVALGLGSQLHEDLSVGVSLTVGLDNQARSPTFVPEATAYDALSLSNEVGVELQLSPHFGVAYSPLEHLTLTATLHTEQALEVEAAFSSFLPDGSEQFAVRRFTHHFVPLTAALGASYEVPLGRHALELLAGARFERWSRYRDRHDVRPRGDLAWSDTLNPTLGLRHRAGDWQSGLDATYVTSPVPEQRGRTNYVDNDRVGLSGLLERRFALGGVSLRAGLGVQAHRLLARSHDKRTPPDDYAGDDLVRDEVPDDAVEKLDASTPVEPREGLQTNNPGYPGFESEGWLFAASLELGLLF